jgi:hypothetical protein
MSIEKKVRVIKTYGEFEYLDYLVRELGFKDFKSYFITSSRQLTRKFNICQSCITPAYGEKERKEFYFPNQETYDAIFQISILKDTSIAAVIDEILISPLLLPQIEDKSIILLGD